MATQTYFLEAENTAIPVLNPSNMIRLSNQKTCTLTVSPGTVGARAFFVEHGQIETEYRGRE